MYHFFNLWVLYREWLFNFGEIEISKKRMSHIPFSYGLYSVFLGLTGLAAFIEEPLLFTYRNTGRILGLISRESLVHTRLHFFLSLFFH